jgi:hypothetical protein
MHVLLTLLTILAVCAAATLGMASGRNLKDAALKLTRALPNGAASVTTATAIDLGQSTSLGAAPTEAEFLLTAPALTTTELPDTVTMKYDVIMSDNSDLSSPVTLYATVITQTGAGAAGAAAATFRFDIPSDAKRYLGFKATNSGAGNASGKSATLEVLT